MSLATGHIDPTSSMRLRRSCQPIGRGFELNKARTALISFWAMGFSFAATKLCLRGDGFELCAVSKLAFADDKGFWGRLKLFAL
jgi:hypothetical protein